MAETEGSTSVPEGDSGAQGDVSTSGAPASESSTATAPTPEERDAATFAAHGLNPDGTPLAPKPADPAPAEAAKPEPKADESTEEGEAGDDDEGDEGDAAEITDERITATVEAALELNPDLVKSNPKIRELLAAEIRAEIQADLDAKQAATTASQQREQLIGQGKKAVATVTTLLENAQAELAKAKNGDPNVNWEVLAKASTDVEAALGTFGSAAVVDTQRGYEAAFTKGFLAAAKVGGPLTEAENTAVQEIVNTANRIEADDKQGDERFDAAKRHFYEKTWEFIAERAKAAGKAEAIAEAKAKRDSRKTVLDADAVIAGAAKEAAKRVKLPPAPTDGGPSSTIVQPTMDSYRAAKQAGNYDLADEIMRAMEKNTPATTRR
jgi:hypothetical protein